MGPLIDRFALGLTMFHACPANEHLLISYRCISKTPALQYAISDSEEIEIHIWLL